MAFLRETIPLRKIKILKKSIGGTIGVLLLSGFLSIFAWVVLFADLIDPCELFRFLRRFRCSLCVVWLSFWTLLICWNPLYQHLYFKRYFYDMDDDNIIIRKGVFAQKEITLPFSRITDVYVDQDILDVLFGLYDVHISTPTQESGRFAHIDGVNKAGSVELRQMILDRINMKS